MPARSVRLSFAIVAVAVSLSGSIVEARQGSIRISYAAPQVVAHQAVYETLRQRHVLERTATTCKACACRGL
jgi:hypothetical protein